MRPSTSLTLALLLIVVGVIGVVLLVRTVTHRGPREVGSTSDAGVPVDAHSNNDVEAETPAGTLLGTRDGTMSAFMGIPYALPPTGDARFRPPTRAARASATIDARTSGPLCPQIPLVRGLLLGDRDAPLPVEGEEDCLRLNVFTHLDGTARPVMVYLHGGGFQRGGGMEAQLGGSELVRRSDVVLVTVHYRLGALGMIALESLAHESTTGSTGNQGIRDQVMALEWVRDNIASLGGDPSRVTIFGESAGAESVCALIASPLAQGLFSGAIAESGGGCARWPTLREGIEGRLSGFGRGAEIVDAAGCGDARDVAACMRALDAATLVRAGMHGEQRLHLPVFGPVIDGTVLTASAYDRLDRGEVDVPLIVGSNADESSAFTVFARVDEASYPARIQEIAGPDTQAALRIWPPQLAGTAVASFRRAFTELLFVCPAEDLARVAAGGRYPSFAYRFTRQLPGSVGQRFGAFHGVELWYLFASAPEGDGRPDADRAVVDTMHGAWAGFATTGAPITTPAWTPYTQAAPAIFWIDAPATLVADVSQGRCAAARAAGIRRPL